MSISAKAHLRRLVVPLLGVSLITTPAMAEGWFQEGAAAPQREHFAYDPETKTHPGWWDYLYELANRELAVVNGKVVKEI